MSMRVQCADWSAQASHVIDALADLRRPAPYWDLLAWSESVKSQGAYLCREVESLRRQCEAQLAEASKSGLQLHFNGL